MKFALLILYICNVNTDIREVNCRNDNVTGDEESNNNSSDNVQHHESDIGPKEEQCTSQKNDEDYIHERLYCSDCDTYHEGKCGFLKIFDFERIIKDSPVPMDEPLRAIASVPKGLIIQKSKIKGARRGVFAYQTFHEGKVFMPYGGIFLLAMVTHDQRYCFVINQRGKQSYLIDAKPIQHSNWLRYINSPLSFQKANLKAIQYRGVMFFAIIKTIHPGDELLIWYGDTYSLFLQLKQDYPIFSCPICGDIFVKLEYKESHAYRHQETEGECIISKQDEAHLITNQTEFLFKK